MSHLPTHFGQNVHFLPHNVWNRFKQTRTSCGWQAGRRTQTFTPSHINSFGSPRCRVLPGLLQNWRWFIRGSSGTSRAGHPSREDVFVGRRWKRVTVGFATGIIESFVVCLYLCFCFSFYRVVVGPVWRLISPVSVSFEGESSRRSSVVSMLEWLFIIFPAQEVKNINRQREIKTERQVDEEGCLCSVCQAKRDTDWGAAAATKQATPHWGWGAGGWRRSWMASVCLGTQPPICSQLKYTDVVSFLFSSLIHLQFKTP